MDEEDESIEQTPDSLFAWGVIYECALGVVAIVLGWFLGPDPRTFLPELTAADAWAIGVGIGQGLVAAIPILILVAILQKIPWEPIREIERLSDDGVIAALLELRTVELCLLSLCAGVGEELLFRGWLMPWLAGADEVSIGATLKIDPYSINWILALIGSSIAFGLVHPITRLYVFLAGLMGMYFGILLMATENLLVPIIAHAAYDAVQLLITSHQKSKSSIESC